MKWTPRMPAWVYGFGEGGIIGVSLLLSLLAMLAGLGSETFVALKRPCNDRLICVKLGAAKALSLLRHDEFVPTRRRKKMGIRQVVHASDGAMITRRKLAISAAAIASLVTATTSFAQSPSADVSPLPDPKTFQSGDLLWPKKPGDYVPYLSGFPAGPSEDERRWIADRDSFVANASNSAPYLTATDVERLRTLSFREFYAEYVGDQVPNMPGVYASGRGLYVGHVAIIEIDSGKPWVIEAISGPGVVRNSYEDWLRGRPGELIWHGRVQSDKDLAQITAQAKKYLGRPYNFWNLDLADTRGFYCSKLAWLSIRDALNIAIDGNDNPRRSFWFSPKKLLYLDKMKRLHEPEETYLRR
jgi:permuted papain-like amidase YaeF/Yiix C92 family enzyme